MTFIERRFVEIWQNFVKKIDNPYEYHPSYKLPAEDLIDYFTEGEPETYPSDKNTSAPKAKVETGKIKLTNTKQANLVK